MPSPQPLPRVSVARHPDYQDPAGVRDAIVRTLAPLGGIGAFVRPGQRVLLKPNFVRAMDPASGAVTHPVFIAEVARLAREAGASDVMVGDSPAFGSAANAAKVIGLTPMLDAVGARVVEFRAIRRVRHGLENGTFKALSLAGEALDADVLINLPKAKAHCQMVLTCATKNLFGCIPGRKKALMHCLVNNSRYLFGRMLIDNARALGGALHLVDGIVGMQGMGPTRGTPYNWGWVLASADFVAVDRVMAAALEYSEEDIPHLVAARHMGVGPESLSGVELVGASIADMGAPGWERAGMLPITFNPIRLAIGYFKHLRQWKVAPR